MKNKKTHRRTNLFTIVAVCCGLLIVALILFGNFGGKSADLSEEPAVQELPLLGRDHVPEGTIVTYNSNPPTSGEHWPQPADWGFYDQKLPDEILVHNLEHGGIWISYKDVDEETKSKIKSIAEKYSQAVIASSRPENDVNITAASWGKLLKLDSFNEESIEKFIKSNVNKAPEPQASLEEPAVRVGSPFPSFSFKEVDGREITKDALKGRPVIMWFTTSYCVPCQIGARLVARLDNELGGKAFEVVVVFVDPRESNDDLKNWRKSFANPDWMIAFDNGLGERIGLKFLDSKFTVDHNGIIQNIDFKTADADYLATIRRIAEENQ